MPNNKTEKKEFKITIDVQQTLYTLMDCVVKENDISMAAYVRSCVIKDLDVRGLMTKEALLRLAS